jgi:hypothetical protein
LRGGTCASRGSRASSARTKFAPLARAIRSRDVRAQWRPRRVDLDGSPASRARKHCSDGFACCLSIQAKFGGTGTRAAQDSTTQAYYRRLGRTVPSSPEAGTCGPSRNLVRVQVAVTSPTRRCSGQRQRADPPGSGSTPSSTSSAEAANPRRAETRSFPHERLRQSSRRERSRETCGQVLPGVASPRTPLGARSLADAARERQGGTGPAPRYAVTRACTASDTA